MHLWRKPLLIGAIILTVVILVSCTPGSAFPSAMLPTSSADTISQPGTGARDTESPLWIAIDPIPVIEANESFRISGTTNIQQDEGLNIHINLVFSSPEARASGRTSYNMYAYYPVWRQDGRNIWEVDNDPQQYKPDQCTVHVTAVKHGVYTTAVYPSRFPQVSEPDTPYRIHLNPTGSHTLNDSFTISGSTNLPKGYPLMIEVYPGVFTPEDFGSDVDYDPLLQEMIEVRQSDDGSTFFSLPVNLTGYTRQNGRPLAPGDYFAEVHAINMNSTVSDSLIFTMSTDTPWIRIDPFDEPVQGTNLSLSGTTNLPAGNDVFINIATLMHPCPTYSIPPDHDTGSYCGGNKCSIVNIFQSLPTQNTTEGTRSWEFEVSTENWCKSESYYVRVSTADQEGAGEDHKYFRIRSV